MEEKKKGGKTGLVVILSIVIGVLIAFIAFAVFFIGFLISTEDDNTDSQSTKATTTTADESKKVSHTFDDGSFFTLSLTENDNIVMTVVGSNKERASFIYAGLIYKIEDYCSKSTIVTETVGYIDNLELKGVFTVVYQNGKTTGTIPSWCNIDKNNTTLSKEETQEFIIQIYSGIDQFKKLIN